HMRRILGDRVSFGRGNPRWCVTMSALCALVYCRPVAHPLRSGTEQGSRIANDALAQLPIFAGLSTAGSPPPNTACREVALHANSERVIPRLLRFSVPASFSVNDPTSGRDQAILRWSNGSRVVSCTYIIDPSSFDKKLAAGTFVFSYCD